VETQVCASPIRRSVRRAKIARALIGVLQAITIIPTVTKRIRKYAIQSVADGNNLRRLTAGPTIDARPAYSPNGSKLAFVSNRDGNAEIYVLNLR